MLRFDVPPVWSNVTRWEAFVAFLVAGAALVWSPWLMIIMAVRGLVRRFGGRYTRPSRRVSALADDRPGRAGAGSWVWRALQVCLTSYVGQIVRVRRVGWKKRKPRRKNVRQQGAVHCVHRFGRCLRVWCRHLENPHHRPADLHHA